VVNALWSKLTALLSVNHCGFANVKGPFPVWFYLCLYVVHGGYLTIF